MYENLMFVSQNLLQPGPALLIEREKKLSHDKVFHKKNFLHENLIGKFN